MGGSKMRLSSVVLYSEKPLPFEDLKALGWIAPLDLGGKPSVKSLVRRYKDIQFQLVRNQGFDGHTWVEVYIHHEADFGRVTLKGEGLPLTVESIVEALRWLEADLNKIR